MKFEHFGINVPDAVALAKWYVDNVGMQIVVGNETAPYAHFLADSSGRTIIEIYSNPDDPIPDYSAQHHLRFHFAFATDEPDAMMDKLIKAGATLVIDETTPDGSRVITLRDPWNIPVQLAKRTTPMP
jgi:catechol-2,3-dioxygenase